MWMRCGAVVLSGSLMLLVALELRHGPFRKSWSQDGARRARNLWFLAASVLVMLWLPAIGEWLRPRIRPLLGWHERRGVELMACVLAAELIGWFLHYIKHRNAFLWSFHFQHHRESQYNLWLTTHTHGLEVVISGALMTGALSLLGFSRAVIASYLLFYTFAKVYQHSAHDYTLGVLDRLIIGPRYHRLHHRIDCRCNYGISLTLIDVLFRTARWPRERVLAPRGDDQERTSPAREEQRAETRYGVAEAEGLPFGFWPEMLYFLSAGTARGGKQNRGK
jgi:sterol desaturase/sphingolipid hydroxylase (fatty acid hydroxylase superfamily)